MDDFRVATDSERDLAGNRAVGRPLLLIVKGAQATWHVAFVALALSLIGLGIVAFLRSSPAITTYIARIQFVFPQVETGSYPSGLKFSINDVIDSSVLNKVYNDLKLDQYKIDLAEFYSGFAIRPFAFSESEIGQIFRSKLADRRLTAPERERLETQLKERLDAASRSAAELSFSLRARFNLPDQLGRLIINSVLLTWSRTSIEQRGVLRLPGYAGSDVLIDKNAQESMPLAVGIVRLHEGGRRLTNRIIELSSLPGVRSLRDPLSGKSLSDAGREVEDFIVFRVNPLRYALVTYRFREGGDQIPAMIEQRLQDLRKDIAETNKQANAIGETMSQYVNAVVGLKGRPVARRDSNSEQPSATGNIVIPQLGADFLDRIVELTSRGATEQKYVEDLSRQHLNLSMREIKLKTEENNWQNVLDAFRSKTERQLELSPDGEAKLTSTLGQSIDELNAKWAMLNRMEAEFSISRLGTSSQLYQQYAVADDLVRSGGPTNLANILFVLAGSLALTILIWLGAAFMHAHRHRALV